ncbi:hypothetical protein SAMN03159343_0703 [Klenkia marina]|uniref:DNA-directed RNA polymerase specialized sigma subunit, sigma24 family n=1 Tax=Klenkia marina TaxID=1960309 RepID=A0A1G4XEI5_9ACTN|nr:hypothetical protein [Klenkia marina]SCX39576.1 hypothetical protein SAMN03159343_0703 [Klenkia marina]
MDDWRTLLPTAYLLTGSDAGARDLLARGLAGGGGLDGLVRAHLRRRFGRDASIAGTSGDPWWLSPADVATARATAAALDDLDRPARTATVLRWHERLPAVEVARLVPGTDPDPLPDRLGIPADELPARLEGLAELTDLRDLTDGDVAEGVRAVRSRRRARVLLAVGAVAVLGAGAVWLPGALPSAPPTAAAGTDAPAAGPPRGSLAENDALVAALRGRLDPGQDDGRLVYAGDVAGRRWVLFVRMTDGAPSAYWFTGDAGADPADLLLSGASFTDGGGPAAWSMAVGTAGGTTLLVVADPGEDVEVTPGFAVAADGTASLAFTPADTEDGVAAAQLSGAVGPPALAYRLVRDGEVLATEQPVNYVSDVEGSRARPEPGAPRSGPGPVDRTAFDAAVDQAVVPTGLAGTDLAVAVLGAGQFPAPGGLSATAVTVAVTFPSGGVVTSTAWAAQETGGGRIATCGVETHPAGTDLAALTVVTRCSGYATDSSTFGATVLVVAPTGAAVRVSDDAGAAVQQPDLDAGWAYVVDGADALTVYEADGVPGEVSRAGAGPYD